MRAALVILILLLGLAKVLESQNLHITYFSEANGLPSNQVRHVVHDDFGFLWIACDGGLIRFDGSNFSDYTQQIQSQYGRFFCPIEEGLLVSHDAGIGLIQSGLDTAHVSLFMEASIDPEEDALYYPGQLFLRQNGELWVSQPGGRISMVASGDRTDFKTDSYAPDDPDINAFFSELDNGIFTIAFTSGELYVYDDNRKIPEKIISLSRINDLKSRGNELWIAGDHIQRIVLTGDGKQIQDQETFETSLGEVTSLALDSKGNIFMGIRKKGLYYLDRREGRKPVFIKVFSSNDPHRVDELPFKNIHNIVLESDDILWICSSEGLGILQRRFFESIGSIPNANTTSICISDNSKIFVNFGDIYVIERTDLGFEGASLPPFAREPVTALTAAGDHLWAGTSTGNLIELDQYGRRQRSVDLRSRGEGIYYLAYDNNKRLWVCQAPEERPVVGICCILPNGELKEYGYNKGLQSRLLCLRETGNDRIYASGIGKGTYLYRYLPEEDAFINLSLPLDFSASPNFEVHDLTIDGEGVVWLASTNGLLRYDMDRVRQVDLGPEFTDIETRAVTDMPDGSIWISTDTEGILRYKNGETVVIKEESGLPSKVMTYRCLVKDHESRLWVGSAEGVVYSLDENPEPQESEKPLLISVSIDGTRTTTESIRLFQDQQLVLRFVTPAFHGYRMFYQHRTDRGTWSDPSTLRELTFDHLEPGDHTIELRSRNEGGYFWSIPVQVEISVRSYWYNNRLLRWIVAALLLVLILWLFLYRKRQYSEYIKRLNRGLQIEKEALEKRDADLVNVKKKIQFEHRQLRAHMLSMEIMHRLISKVTPGMKWDVVLEIISIDLLKLPGVMAFEIGTREGKFIELEGFSERVRNFTTERISYNPDVNLAAYCIENAKPLMFNHIEEEVDRILSEWDCRLTKYKSVISVPFYLENKHAVLSIYSDKADLFDDYSLKAMSVFATYLEQIH